jgi:threonine synthase
LKNTIIKYYSTNRRSPEVTFREALLGGLAPDGGLYLPDSFPLIDKSELESFSGMEYHEIAFSVLEKLIGNEIGHSDLKQICRDAYCFEVPLEKVKDRKYIMRLDRGPTASFKDFAARVMSRLMQYFLASGDSRLTILTATSGDTGSAVASAFYGLPDIDVIILFPKDEVTDMQRKQMTTLHKNISVLAIDGKFDDCQRLVKQAFMDSSLSHLPLSSANSINIGRLLPQSVYYFYSWAKLSGKLNDRATFSVPSGNFGNLMGGIVASKMGLPVDHFVISTNENDEVPAFFQTGVYTAIDPSRNCISSAMNVGHPSNLARIIDLYGGMMNEKGIITREPDMKKIRDELFSVSVNDTDTITTIKEVYSESGILLEPHGAVAWRGLNEYLGRQGNSHPAGTLSIALETAHPAKFPAELRSIIKKDPELPAPLEGLTGKTENYTMLGNDYGLLKEFIINNT